MLKLQYSDPNGRKWLLTEVELTPLPGFIRARRDDGRMVLLCYVGASGLSEAEQDRAEITSPS